MAPKPSLEPDLEETYMVWVAPASSQPQRLCQRARNRRADLGMDRASMCDWGEIPGQASS